MSRDEVRTGGPLLVAGTMMLIAFNLRPALSSIGPLLNRIAAETGLGTVGAALLTTMPVLCLGLAGMLAPPVIRRFGLDLGVLAGILLVAAGLALRGLGSVVPLFAGSAIAAAGIGLAGVLLPAIVKRGFPQRVGLMMGVYTMVLCLGAAAGAGLTVPVEVATGWGWAPILALWALPALAAALAWLPFAQRTPAAMAVRAAPGPRLRRDPLAWQVTGFMGLQSSLAYVMFGWLPVVLQSRGLSALDAGLVASLMTLGQAPGALGIAALAARARDQRGWIVGTMLVVIAAFLVTVFGPLAVLIPAGLALGVALGGCFGLALTVIVLRAADAGTAGRLSAMAQGIGYTLASLGPLGFGLAHEATGGWGLASALFCALALGSMACGLGAGRNRHVGQH